MTSNDPWNAPYSVKIIHNFLESKYEKYIYSLIESKKFHVATQSIGNNKTVQEEHKIRMDYTLTPSECSVIDIPLVMKSESKCHLRERWRILHYDGTMDKKSFRGPHTDWTSHSCHRRMSIIIGLSEPSMYTGGELVFKNNNLQYKIERGAAVVFDSRLVHEVLPVTSGQRYVLQAFLFDDTGFNLRKQYINISNFTLLENKLQSKVIQDKDWLLITNKNAVYGQIRSYNENYVGDFHSINEVISALSQNTHWMYFTWHKPNHIKSKWSSRAYAWTKEICEEKNRSNVEKWPHEDNVISGYKKFDVTTTKCQSYLTLINTDGGPGNQIVGIKEGILMASILNRIFVFPPILQHYTLNREFRGNISNLKYWKFTDIFTYTTDALNLMDGTIDVENNTIYCCREQDILKSLRMETLVNFNGNNKKMIPKKRFSCVDDYDILKTLKEDTLIISHLFNCTALSECYWNGCDICKMNPQLLELYSDICSKFDFSQMIKTAGDTFIKEHFDNRSFLAIHIRYPDYITVPIKNINNMYDEEDIYECILKICNDENILVSDIFIATNNQKEVINSCLGKFQMLKSLEAYNELESFIEQYICCQSCKFIYTGGIHAKPDHTHLRSTWGSFVLDYRRYLLNKSEESNVYLTNLFNIK